MSRTDLSHWRALWRLLGVVSVPSAWHSRMVTAYSEPHRKYHNLQHLTECLVELDASRELVRNPSLVEIALWFHDAIYDPQSNTNEEDSAALATSCLSESDVATGHIEVIRRLIISTKAHQSAGEAESALLLDIDLSILGKPHERFWAYESGIRAEYAWVPETTYREKRAEILESFLARPTIYHLSAFRDRYEASARANLAAAISRLKNPQH